MTLAPVARHLQKLLMKKVLFVPDPFRGEAARNYHASPDILFFENIRFWPEEAKNSVAFAKRMARWGDCYVNDAFANCHRREASLVALPKIIPSYAGLHLIDEITALEKIIRSPKRPLIAVLGGAKIETKLPLIERFMGIADRILVGGALANTAFALMGKQVGVSRIDAPVGKIKMSLFADKKLLLAVDAVVARSPALTASSAVRGIDTVGKGERIVDIGPETQKIFAAHIRDAKTIVWNGPMGIAEIPEYAKGTRFVARAVEKSRAFSVVGGGDTVAALRRLRMLKGFGHVSTGGGAMLEFLAGKKLPALEVLKK